MGAPKATDTPAAAAADKTWVKLAVSNKQTAVVKRAELLVQR